MARKAKMRLGMSMRGLGYHPAAWRHPQVPADGTTPVTAAIAVSGGPSASRPVLVDTTPPAAPAGMPT